MTARPLRRALAALAAGVVLAVMPAASPAHADPAADQAAKQVAKERCARLDSPLTPHQLIDVCESKVAQDLLSGAAQAGDWAKSACKWIPDLPIIGNACDKITAALIGAWDEFQQQAQALRGVVNAVANPVDTAITNLADTVGAALRSLLDKVLTEMVHLSSPDLQSSAFLSTYAAGAGLGMFVLVIMVARVFYRASTGDITGEALAESLWRWVPTAMVLVLFGPGLGYLLTQLTDAASVSIVEYFGDDLAGLAAKLEGMVVLSNVGGTPGGPLVGLLIMALGLIGVLALVGGLMFQLLALYLTGAVMAVAFVMTVDPKTRAKALRLPTLWVGLSLSKPLLFFMIGALGRLANSAFSLQAIQDDGLRSLVTAVVAALALVVVGLAPWSLLKFAPLLPDGNSHRMARATRGQGGGAMGAMASSAMMQLSLRRMQGGGPAGGGSQDDGPGPAGGTVSMRSHRPPQPVGQGSTGTSRTANTAASRPSPAGGPAAGGKVAAGQAGGSGAAGGAGAAAAGAATGGVAAAALIGVQAVDAAKRKGQDTAHRAGDVVPGE